MKPTEFWCWNIPHAHKPGKTSNSRWKMTEAAALAQYPTATRVQGTMEIRDLAESEEEFRGLDSGRWAQKPGPNGTRCRG